MQPLKTVLDCTLVRARPLNYANIYIYVYITYLNTCVRLFVVQPLKTVLDRALVRASPLLDQIYIYIDMYVYMNTCIYEYMYINTLCV